LRLSHRHVHLRAWHPHYNLRLRDVDCDRWSGLPNHNFGLGLVNSHLWLLLLDRNVRGALIDPNGRRRLLDDNIGSRATGWINLDQCISASLRIVVNSVCPNLIERNSSICWPLLFQHGL
jgi:hypothetical protein